MGSYRLSCEVARAQRADECGVTEACGGGHSGAAIHSHHIRPLEALMAAREFRLKRESDAALQILESRVHAQGVELRINL